MKKEITEHTEHLLISASTVTGCVSISTLASLVGIAVGIADSSITIQNSVITAGIKITIKSTNIKRKKKEHDKIALLVKSKKKYHSFYCSWSLNDSNINNDEFVLVNHVLKEYYYMKEEIKNSNDKVKFKLYIKQLCLIIWNVEKVLRVKSQKLWKRGTEEKWLYQTVLFAAVKN